MIRYPAGVVAPMTMRHRAAASDDGAASPRATHSPRGRADVRPSVRATRPRALTHHNEDGFTLVELLVVVLMLVALVGIAVPTFVGQQGRAERAAVQSELRTAAIALESHRARNGMYAEAALESPEFGFVSSLDVAVFYEDAITPNRFCVRGWYEAIDLTREVPPEAPKLKDAEAKAEWAITEQGMFFIGGSGGNRECPPRPQ